MDTLVTVVQVDVQGELFALTYGGHFNSKHVEQMESSRRRKFVERLYKQKQDEEQRLKEARTKAKRSKPRRK